MDAYRCFSRFWSVLAVVFLAALTLSAQSAPAYAQDANPDVLSKVTKLNKKALDAYQKRDYDCARDFLKEALDLCKGSGLEKHPIRARTEIHIGIVLISGYKQRDAGITHFKKALQIQPDIQLTKSVSTPALQDAFEEASVAMGGGWRWRRFVGRRRAGVERRQRRRWRQRGRRRQCAAAPEGAARRRRKSVATTTTTTVPRSRSARATTTTADGDDDDGGGANNKGKIFVALAAGGGFGIASGTGEDGVDDTAYAGQRRLRPRAVDASRARGRLLPELEFVVVAAGAHPVRFRHQPRHQYLWLQGLRHAGPRRSRCSPRRPTSSATATSTSSSAARWAAARSATWPSSRRTGRAGQCSAQQNCVDTLAAGPVLVGPNLGIMYDLNKTSR